MTLTEAESVALVKVISHGKPSVSSSNRLHGANAREMNAREMRDGSKSIGKITFLLAHVLTLHHKSNLTTFDLIAVTARVVSLEFVNVSATNDACICW